MNEGERDTAALLEERDIKQGTAESLIRQLSAAVGDLRRLDSSAWGAFLLAVERADEPAKVTMYRRVEWNRELDEQGSLRSPLLEISVGEDTSRDTSMVVADAIRMRRIVTDEKQREEMKDKAKTLLAEHPELQYVIEEEVQSRVGVGQRPTRRV